MVQDSIFNYHLWRLFKGKEMIKKLGHRAAGLPGCHVDVCCVGDCCFHRTYRAYDSYYNDYHKWNDREVEYYARWCHEINRDPGRDYRKLSPTSRNSIGSGDIRGAIKAVIIKSDGS